MLKDYQEGSILLVDKPLDWTSFDVVKKIKFAFKKKLPKLKIGHAGTLDPKATGLLIICTGAFTKKIQEIQDQYKIYTGSFFLGATTACYDTERPVNQTFDIAHITSSDIMQATNLFKGEIRQTPPAHSAIKVSGKNAYELARKGKEVELKERTVIIYEFKITHIHLPLIDFKVKCSKGTYIRSLANDFGKALGAGAYLASLRREQIGEYLVSDAWEINKLAEQINLEIEGNNESI